MEINLKPCPFCGGQANLRATTSGVSVRCRKCLIGTQYHIDSIDKSDSVRKVVEAWNRRENDVTDRQPERKKGQWIHGREVHREYTGPALIMVQYSHWECSVCGYQTENEPLWNFCPICGAEMKDERREP